MILIDANLRYLLKLHSSFPLLHRLQSTFVISNLICCASTSDLFMNSPFHLPTFPPPHRNSTSTFPLLLAWFDMHFCPLSWVLLPTFLVFYYYYLAYLFNLHGRLWSYFFHYFLLPVAPMQSLCLCFPPRSFDFLLTTKVHRREDPKACLFPISTTSNV